MNKPLMPKATAVWLIDKTALSFKQIAEFCGMHPLEVQAIADGEVNTSINGYDPVKHNQLTLDEIKRCEADPEASLKLAKSALPVSKRTKGPRYTPLAKRHDRPDGIAFLIRQYPQLEDRQIVKLMHTTKDTIAKIRARQHWNSPNIKPRDPVILGLCTQTDLNAAVQKANAEAEKQGKTVEQSPLADY